MCIIIFKKNVGLESFFFSKKMFVEKRWIDSVG